jgi:hypothetical protein
MHNIRLDSPSFFCTTSSTTTNFILDNLVANHLGHLKSGRTTACEALIAQRPAGQRPSFFCTTSSTTTNIILDNLGSEPPRPPEERSDNCLRGVDCTASVWTAPILLLYHLVEQ